MACVGAFLLCIRLPTHITHSLYTPSSLSLSLSLSLIPPFLFLYKFIIINKYHILQYFSHIFRRIKMTNKTQDYKCCMCGDHGLTQELFRCKVCHFRSQHRYCSNLYPKADTYNVCNWCLIQKDDDNLTTNTIISNNSSSNSSSPSEKRNTKKSPTNNLNGPKIGPRPTSLQPISPIKKPIMRSPSGEARSPSGRKRITAVHQGPVVAHDEKLRRSKSSVEMSSIKYSNNNNNNNNNSGGPPVIKHVFRNKVRRYKLLDEVSG